jgi:integrase-like protein
MSMWPRAISFSMCFMCVCGQSKFQVCWFVVSCSCRDGRVKAQLHLRNSAVPDCPLVFFRIIKTKENPVPRWLSIGDFRKVWETACAKSGLAGQIFHDLRRSAVRALVRAGVQERVAMRISGHKTRSVFDRYNIVSDQDLTEAVQKLQKFQDAAEPASQPPQSESRVSAVQPAFVN